MPRLVYKKKGKRVCLWIPRKQMETAAQIDNLSKFLQICLDNAADIMAVAILKEVEPLKYASKRNFDDVVVTYNEKYPPNELTQKRQGTWPKNSAPKQELW